MGYVYLLTDGELYKIGVTRGSIDKRIKKLQTGNPYSITIVSFYKTEYPFKLETYMHNKYKDKRINNEWFQLDNDDVSNFNDECLRYEHIIESLKENPFFN